MRLFYFLASVAGLSTTIYFFIDSLFTLDTLNDFIVTALYAILMAIFLIGISINAHSLPKVVRKIKSQRLGAS